MYPVIVIVYNATFATNDVETLKVLVMSSKEKTKESNVVPSYSA